MRFATSPVTGPSAVARSSTESATAPQAVRFGDTLFHSVEEAQWDGAVEASRARGVTLTPLASTASASRLHVVVQKGRLFQQEHPTVPVLLDKGRYLVVDLTEAAARMCDHGDRPCYSVRPLAAFTTAFDTRAAAADRAAPLPWVKALVDQIQRASYEADLTHLVGFGTRHSTSTQYVAAANWARDQFQALGFATSLQTIAVNGKPSQNVVAEKVGNGPTPRGVVIVGAHLDSINIAGGPAAPAPGADDDGSGSAGGLAIARVLKDFSAENDLRVLLFGGEEEGLFGSKKYVASLSATERSRIRAVVHMDMIASLNSPAPTVLLEGAALSQTVIDGLAAAAATYTGLAVQTSLHPFNSDHVPFLDAGVPAVLTIEGTDDANHNIHSAEDTLAHINWELALDILRMNVAFVAQTLGQG